ncbi:hypothetical protein J3B02_000020 [Coemansia erecta]|nr:hypothetical protein J3B02_000020 [Coemansia erecta]KAJ2882626.1 hypothetical protein FB639_002347 [Coemansia asiatica]
MLTISNDKICRLFLALLAITSLVQANTEIRHFRPSGYANPAINPAEVLQTLASHLPEQTKLTAPYSSTDIQTISSVQSTNSTKRQRENWYLLQNLHIGHSYEVRVSYAATTPSDFLIDLYTLDSLASTFDLSLGTKSDRQKAEDIDGTVAMYARVTAVYSGVSAIMDDMQNARIAYRFVLEKHVLGLPYQALKLIAAIIVVLGISFLVVVPRVLEIVNSALIETKQKSKKE